METASALFIPPLLDDLSAPPAAILRGTARGLEVIVDGQSTTTAITAAVMKRLDEAPGFFRGSDVRIRVEDGPLAAGCLARLDEIAVMFELRIVEVTAHKKTNPAAEAMAVPEPNLASGSAPSPAAETAAPVAPSSDFQDEEPTGSKVLPLPQQAAQLAEHVMFAQTDIAMITAENLDAQVTATGEMLDAANEPAGESFEEPTGTSIPLQLAATPEVEIPSDAGTRIVMGPVRSGVILEHLGHLVIFGDINPGAEVRASGNIVVLGRLRGTAHAGIGQDVGFILALRLEPQQLRIGRQVARAADSDKPASEPELAYGTGDSIVVERYQGKLPRNLATSI
jgi:septum site-determining protein MinC